MPARKQIDWQNIIITLLIPAVVFIGSASVLYYKVDDIGKSAKETREDVGEVKERLTRVEERVKFLYDDRKQGKK